MSITITGHSDDLIEIEGDISEEFDAYGEEDYLVTSNIGAVRVEYDVDGIWRIQRLAGDVDVAQATGDGSDEDYSDVGVMHGNVRWVACGNKIYYNKGLK